MIPTAPPTQAASDQTVVILVPGIDLDLSDTLYDPYVVAQETFSPITAVWGCYAAITLGPTSDIPCENGISWIPYSYAGVSRNGQIRPYTGWDTGAGIDFLSLAMGQIVAYARNLRPGATIRILGHSLGGAIATYWGANHPDVEIVTLDSPVNGIWAPDEKVLRTYCESSFGLLDYRTRTTCPLIIGRPSLSSRIAADLRKPGVISQMRLANATHVANPADSVVPSWFALIPGSDNNILLSPILCTGSGSFFTPSGFGANHDCVIEAYANILARGTLFFGTSIRSKITLSISLVIIASPTSGWSVLTEPVLVTISHNSQIVRELWMRVGETAQIDVPWRDLLVSVEYAQLENSYGVLPAENQDLGIFLLVPNA